jgi:hypothetical protein
MSKTLFTVLLASAFVLPLAAHADTIVDFVLTGDGHTITYSLPASAVITDHPHGVTLSASALTTIDGVPGYNESGTYYVQPGLPGLPSMVLTVPSSISNNDELIFFGEGPLQISEIIPISDPSSGHPDDLLVDFNPGTYTLQSVGLALQPFNPPIDYTLTITPETTPPAVPEPSTLALFTTGVLGLGSLVRRRLRI